MWELKTDDYKSTSWGGGGGGALVSFSSPSSY